MTDVEHHPEVTWTSIEKVEEITLEDLAHRMDMFGEQMNWLCENLQSLFLFINQMSANGGGIRGMMKAMKETPGLMETGAEE